MVIGKSEMDSQRAGPAGLPGFVHQPFGGKALRQGFGVVKSSATLTIGEDGDF